MLIKGISNKKTQVSSFKQDLELLGNYDTLIEEYGNNENISNNKKQNFKYIKKEQELINNFNYLLQSILQIKNGKIKYEKKIDNIRSQYQYLFPFKDNTKLFENMYSILHNYNDFFKTIKSQQYSYITPENKSVIYHYLLIHSLLMILYDTNSVDINKTQLNNVNKSIKQLKKYKQDGEENFLDESDFDNLENIKKNNNVFYIKTNFLVLFIKQITKRQECFDNLTQDYISEEILRVGEKKQRKNLKIFNILKTTEGMEEYHNMILSKLHYGLLEYENLESINTEIDNVSSDNIIENDDANDKEIYKTTTEDDDVLDGNFNDGIMVYDSDDDVEDEDYANVNYED